MNFSKDNKTSVKCNQQPGGKSTFTLAWDDGNNKAEEQKKPQVIASTNANQNYGQNVGTQGVAAGKQTQQGQGNQSSIVLGDDKTNYYDKQPNQSNPKTQAYQQQQLQYQQQAQQQQQPQQFQQQQPLFQQQPQQNQQPQAASQQNVKTSVKVHNPPGGKSNFTLG